MIVSIVKNVKLAGLIVAVLVLGLALGVHSVTATALNSVNVSSDVKHGKVATPKHVPVAAKQYFSDNATEDIPNVFVSMYYDPYLDAFQMYAEHYVAPNPGEEYGNYVPCMPNECGSISLAKGGKLKLVLQPGDTLNMGFFTYAQPSDNPMYNNGLYVSNSWNGAPITLTDRYRSSQLRTTTFVEIDNLSASIYSPNFDTPPSYPYPDGK